jgi:hypothetical protein
MKTWILKIESVGNSRLDALRAVNKLMSNLWDNPNDLPDSCEYSLSNLSGAASAVFAEGPETEDENHL